MVVFTKWRWTTPGSDELMPYARKSDLTRGIERARRGEPVAIVHLTFAPCPYAEDVGNDHAPIWCQHDVCRCADDI